MFQVMVRKRRGPVACGGVRVQFVARGDMAETPVVERNTPRGVRRVASAEATAKTTCPWGTGSRTRSVRNSPKKAARLAWQLGQTFRVWQKNAIKCSDWHAPQRRRVKPL